MIDALVVGAGTFHADDRGWVVSCNNFIRLFWRKLCVIRKADDAHGDGDLPQFLHVLLQVQAHTGGQLADGLVVGPGADDDGLCPESNDQRPAQQGGTDDAVHLRFFVRPQYEAGHNINDVAIFQILICFLFHNKLYFCCKDNDYF